MEQTSDSVDTTNQTPPSLGVQDLLLMLQTIQVITQRGAFRAEELTPIGGLHDRLVAFLTHAGVIRKPESSSTMGANDITQQGVEQ